jgi:hypothetical protein
MIASPRGPGCALIGLEGDAVDHRVLAPAALVAALLTAAAPGLALAQQPAGERAGLTPVAGTRFKCQEGADLIAHFDTQAAGLVAVVDAGEGPHALPIRPWDGGPVRLTWSDGQRTMTWSPGVQIMWMDGVAHRMCGRAGGHNH